jgi:predicted transcriptional regulator
MTTLRIGIAGYEAFKARTIAIARGELKPAPDDPKIWFSSLESFAKVLSDRNRELLAVIAETQPASISELAQMTGRALPNLSRTLKTMERHGLLRFEERQGRQRAPRVSFTRIALDMPLSETRSAA